MQSYPNFSKYVCLCTKKLKKIVPLLLTLNRIIGNVFVSCLH